jgi:hypothetical protein
VTHHWLPAFAFTQAVEVPIYLVALGAAGGSRARRVAVAFGASALTHPIVWWLLPRAWESLYLAIAAPSAALRIASPGGRFVARLLFSEAFAVGAEAAYLRAWGLRRALAWSLVANAASVALGLASRALFAWP